MSYNRYDYQYDGLTGEVTGMTLEPDGDWVMFADLPVEAPVDVKIPNFNTMADLFDRLIVCVNKLAFFENRKREAQACSKRDAKAIADWDNASRNECEIRNLLKREIDKIFAESIAAGEYRALPDFRTFRASEKTIADILAEQCDEIGVTTKAKLQENWS